MFERIVKRLRGYFPPTSKTFVEETERLAAQIASEEKAFLFFLKEIQIQMENVQNSVLKVQLELRERAALWEKSASKGELLLKHSVGIMETIEEELQEHSESTVRMFKSQMTTLNMLKEELREELLEERGEQREEIRKYVAKADENSESQMQAMLELKEQFLQQSENQKEELQNHIESTSRMLENQMTILNMLKEELREELQAERREQKEEIRKYVAKADESSESQIQAMFELREQLQQQSENQKEELQNHIESTSRMLKNQMTTLDMLKEELREVLLEERGEQREEIRKYAAKADENSESQMQAMLEVKEQLLQQSENQKEELQNHIESTSKMFENQMSILKVLKEELQEELLTDRESVQKVITEMSENIEKQVQGLNHLKEILSEYYKEQQADIAHCMAEGKENSQEQIDAMLELTDKMQKQIQVQKEEEIKLSDFHTEVMRELRVRKNIKPKQIYMNLTEREALAKSFGEIMNDGRLFEEKFIALIHGLDEKSRQNVIRILTRMSKILDGNTKGLDLFSQEEQDELLKMKTDFSDQILKISDTLYCYNGYLLPVKQFDASVFWSKYGVEEVQDMEKVAQGDIIDAGGYVGDTALLFSPMTTRKVYVFEASPANYDLVCQTMEMNNLKNVQAENLALGKERGILPLSLGERGSCNTLVERPGYVYPSKIDVKVVSLDEYVSENDLQVSVIKIDVEGGEQLVLSGALETIRRFKPLLLISIYHTASDFFDIKPMIENLNLGYKFKVYKPVNNAIAIETVLIAEVR